MRFVAFVVALAVGQAVPAQTITVYGQGTRTCAEWGEAHNEDNWTATVMDAWLGGYATGMNDYAATEWETSVPFPALKAWLTKYCADNPLDKIAVAAQRLARELKSRKAGENGNP